MKIIHKKKSKLNLIYSDISILSQQNNLIKRDDCV